MPADLAAGGGVLPRLSGPGGRGAGVGDDAAPPAAATEVAEERRRVVGAGVGAGQDPGTPAVGGLDLNDVAVRVGVGVEEDDGPEGCRRGPDVGLAAGAAGLRRGLPGEGPVPFADG